MSLGDLDIPGQAEVWAEQEELDRLISAGHPNLWRENEIFWPNRNYGFSTILKAHAGWELARPLPAVMPHGVRLELYGAKQAHPFDVHPQIRAALAYPAFVETAYAGTAGIDKVVGICSPFLYALAEFQRRFPETGLREGTVFFPRHSTAAKKVRSPYLAIAEALHGLPQNYHPVRVCVHWQDAVDGLAEFFRSQGFPVLCCGGLHDPRFLFRLLHFFSSCRYSCSQALTSNTFYSLAAGVETFLLDAPVEIIVDPRLPQMEESTAARLMKRQLEQTLGPVASKHELQPRQQIALEFLGADKRMGSVELLEVLKSL
jgi:hypothetical protein